MDYPISMSQVVCNGGFETPRKGDTEFEFISGNGQFLDLRGSKIEYYHYVRCKEITLNLRHFHEGVKVRLALMQSDDWKGFL